MIPKYLPYILSFLFFNAIQPAFSQEGVQLVLDQARVIQMPERTQTLVLGNPGIADATLVKKNNAIVLTGKSFGQTNLIALDTKGNILAEMQLEVSAPQQALIFQSGTKRFSYSCLPTCQPVLSVGDNTTFTTELFDQLKLYKQIGEGQK